jgi:hypothetical protein
MTLALSFIIGLELHSYRRVNNQDLGFGTTRTFTLIGVLGFVLYLVDDHHPVSAVSPTPSARWRWSMSFIEDCAAALQVSPGYRGVRPFFN